MTATHDSSAAPADTRKMASRLSDRISEDIVTSGLAPGTVLGSEAELIARYGVSRAIFREAVRLVEHYRLAEMRRGPGGGLVVTAPNPSATVEAMATYLQYVKVSVAELFEARLVIEPLAMELAAERIRESGITRMRASVDAERALGGLYAEDRHGLHHIIGDLSQNSVVRVFMEVLTSLTTMQTRRPRNAPAQTSEVARTAAAAHARITEAIVAGDSREAERILTKHLQAMADWLEHSAGGGGRTESGDDSQSTGPVAAEPGRKLAEVVARRVRSDIIARDWPVGEMIGSESELLERYQVSRDVFREAVRLLEHQSVARTRRGPGGGLLVDAPMATPIIRSMAVYLDYQQVSAQDLQRVRVAIELRCLVRLLVANRSAPDPALRSDLEAALRTTHAAGTAEVDRNAADLHLLLVDAAGNKVLSLFLRVLVGLQTRHLQRPDAWNFDEEAEVLNADIERAHRGITEAILASDRSLALHRMQRHLNAVSDWY